VGAVAVVAEPAHQGVVRLRGARRRPATVDEGGAEPEARKRRDDDREGVLGLAAVRDRIGERPDHVEEVDDRPGVAVQQEQRRRILLGRRHVDEVHGLPVDLGEVLREGVDPLLHRSPVELALPVLDRLLQVVVRRAVVPVVARCRLGEPGACEALLEVVEVRLRDLDAERADVGGAGALLLRHGSTVDSQ
jgi:hypothetical protein